jgi:autotransporter-associated beta strand protein
MKTRWLLRFTATLGFLASHLPCAAAMTYWIGCPSGFYFSNASCWTAMPTSLAFPRVLVFNGGEAPLDDIANLAVAQVQFNGNSVGTFLGGTTPLTLEANGTMPVINSLKGTNSILQQLSLTLVPDVPYATVWVNVAGGEVDVHGILQGPGGLRKTGAGTLALLQNNSFAGPLEIDDGIVALDAPGFDAAVPITSTGIRIGDGGGNPGSARLRDGSNHNISNLVPVTIYVDGQLDLNGKTEAIESLHGSGGVSLPAGSLLQLKTGGLASYQGTISGAGAVEMIGTGIQELAGPNSYTGTTSAISGELRVMGAQASSPVVVTLGGTLRGTGTVGPLAVNVGGVVEPGDGSVFGGVLSVAGIANLASSTGTNLDVSLVSYVPPPGTEFTVLSASGGVTGEFSLKPEGTVLCINGTRMVIYYSATKVTLSVVSDSPNVTAPASITIAQTACN